MDKFTKDINQALIDSTKTNPKYPKGTIDAPNSGEYYDANPWDTIKKLEKLVGLGLKTVSEQQEKIRQLQDALEDCRPCDRRAGGC